MPLYEYKCEGCGETFEVMQKFADQPLAVHDKCGGKVHRLLSAPALQFKGSGWYITDYAKGANGPGKSDSSGDAGKGESKPEAKSESKTDKPASSSPSSTPKSD